MDKKRHSLDGRVWEEVFVDHNVDKALCVSFYGGQYHERWIDLRYKHVTELWIAEGATLCCRFTGLARDCQSKDEFPGAKKYRITTEEIV